MMKGRCKSVSMVIVSTALALGAILLISLGTVYGDEISVQFKICPEAAARISDPDQTTLIYMVPVYEVAMAHGHAPGRLPVREMLRQPGVSFVKEDGLPIGPAGFSVIEVSIGENFPGQKFMLFPDDNEILYCP
jgi:hypothetical protein